MLRRVGREDRSRVPLGSPWLWTKHTGGALQLQLTEPGGAPVVTVIADVGEKTTAERLEALNETTDTDINVSPRDRRSLDGDHDYCGSETPLSTINQAERRPSCWTVVHYYFN